MRKWLYLSPRAKIEKTKGTLFSSTFKIWENKVPLVFKIFAQGLRYSHFLNSRMALSWRCWQKRRKRLYLSSWAKIEKTRGTLFSQTLKVERNKVPSILLIFAQGLRYSHFLNLRMTPLWQGWQKRRKRLYLSSWAKIEKNKGTLFSSSLKVWKSKVPLVFSILAQGLRYSHLLIFCQPHQQGAILEFRKWLFLSL